MIVPPARQRPARGGGLAVLVVVTVVAALAAPHARAVRGLVVGGLAGIVSAAPPTPTRRPPDQLAGRAVAFALAQQGKPYRWGAQGPDAFDCSGLTWAAWRTAGVAIPRTAAGQLAGLSLVRGRLEPGDLVIFASRGPSRRHVAMVTGGGRMVEALGQGVPVRQVPLRRGWLGAVRPGGRR